MDTRKVLSRVKSIRVTIVLDDGHTVDVLNEDPLGIPGVDAGIHSVSSAIGCIARTSDIERYLLDNPLPTPLQDDIRAGKIRSIYKHSGTERGIRAYGKDDWQGKVYEYKTYGDYNEDFEFCEKLLKEINEKSV